MKIKILINKKNKSLQIPIKVEEVRTIYDELWHSISYYEGKKEKLKKYEKENLKIINKLQNKLSFLVHDVVDNGKTYRLEDNKSILEKKPYYVVKKPKWKINETFLK